MEFKNSQSYRCFKSICIWSLLSDIIVICCFLTGYIITCIVGLIKGNDFAQGFGWLAIVIPTILLKLFFLICFAVANGYFIYILYLEYRKKAQNLPLAIVNKTEEIFNKIIKNNIIKIIVTFLAILSYAFNLFILITDLCAILFRLYIMATSSFLKYIWHTP